MTVQPTRLAWLKTNEWFFATKQVGLFSFIQHSVAVMVVAVLILLVRGLEIRQLQ
jgi:hypothetical protein